MAFSRVFTPLALLAVACATLCETKVQWGPCEEGEFNTTLALECGTVKVPLDYTQPNSSQFDLHIVKIPAAVQPSRGSIQHNFGGPGLEARQSLVLLGPILQQLSGGIYDLLAFDPRGVGKTLPFTCTDEPYFVGQVLNEIRSGEQADTALRRLWARGKVDGNICEQLGNANKTAELIGTAFTARDFMTVVDALEEDGMLRYWGFSYGTTLGATLASMFPDRIDKLVIDGVQNPHDYYNAHADFEEWTDTDKTFSHFFQTCVEAGPEKCALAASNKTAAELEQDTWNLFEFIREAPIPAGTMIFDLITVKGFLIESLKGTGSWPVVAQLLAVVLYGSDDQKDALFESIPATVMGTDGVGFGNLGVVENIWGIHCGDRIPREDSFGAIAPTFEKLNNISRLQGDVVHSVTAHCAQWPWHAKEIYEGDFNVKTKNPILIAGNSLDAHTPIRSAFNVSEGFEGSGVLEVNGTGHTSISSPSVCSLKYTAAYWVNGTLPEPGFVCDAAHPWDGYTWENVFEEVYGVKETSAEKREAYRRWLH